MVSKSCKSIIKVDMIAGVLDCIRLYKCTLIKWSLSERYG